MEITILELSGKKVEALAETRKLELEQLDSQFHALQKEINVLQDAQTQHELDIAKRKMEIDVLRAAGYELDALAIERAIELDSIDESLRAYQQSAWALQDVIETFDEFNEKIEQLVPPT